jgi:quinol monooxygenase YgiN
MAYLLIRHKTRDYATWKAAFDDFSETRRASGEKSYQIFHPDDDPNNLWLLFEWDNLDNARTFMANPDLKEVMDAAGVIEAPEVHFLEEYGQGTA